MIGQTNIVTGMYVGPFKIIKVCQDHIIVRRNNKNMKYNKSKIKPFQS